VGVSIAEEQVKGIAYRTLREADKDEDKLISFDEFKEVKKKKKKTCTLIWWQMLPTGIGKY